MSIRIIIYLSTIISSLLLATISFACTDFRIQAKDGTNLITRSMEFAADMKSNVRTSNQGRQFNTTAPNGQPGVSWKAKYGYIFLDGFNIDVAIDGMNEKGLSFEALYLPGLAQYQYVPSGQEKNALPYMNLGDWVLSNFDNVADVRKALEKIFVYQQKVPGMGDMVFPLHFSIYEASGKGIVVEYIDGKLSISDNNIGVMTNSPDYKWHMTNLNNYVHLAPSNPNPVIDNGVTFAATGQGYGMIGLPGDISPPSRFVKVATLLQVALPADNANTALNLAEHIINNVDIPRGFAREKTKGNFTTDITQWVVFKDLTNKKFYYRTYDDMTLRAIDLSKIDFAENAKRLKMPLGNQDKIKNMTDQLSQSNNA